MLALLSVWISLASLVLAGTMLVYRPAFTDFAVALVLWLGAPLAMCLAGLTVWAYRKESTADPGLQARRAQCWTAIGISILAAAIVYALIIGSHKVGAGA